MRDFSILGTFFAKIEYESSISRDKKHHSEREFSVQVASPGNISMYWSWTKYPTCLTCFTSETIAMFSKQRNLLLLSVLTDLMQTELMKHYPICPKGITEKSAFLTTTWDKTSLLLVLSDPSQNRSGPSEWQSVCGPKAVSAGSLFTVASYFHLLNIPSSPPPKPSESEEGFWGNREIFQSMRHAAGRNSAGNWITGLCGPAWTTKLLPDWRKWKAARM